MIKYFFLFSLMGVGLAACRKDSVTKIPAPPQIICDTIFVENSEHDTIFSSPYMAAYPGSWWVYDNGETDSCTAWDSLPIFTITKDINGCPTIETKYVFVPRKANDQFIYNNTVVSANKLNYSNKFLQIVGEYGDHWGQNFPGNSDYSLERKGSVDSIFATKTINGHTYNDVIFVRMKFQTVYTHLNNGPISYSHSYYARNIGLIKRSHYYLYEDSTGLDETFGLSAYFIAPH